MGYMLKKALKTLCGVNQWSYAVFWKIGCQNPRLLIWEDCYYEPALCSAETSSSRSCVLAGDNAQLLVSKMMMDSHVNIVGEGLVGRVAFTGNYQWMLSDSYFIETHPPEVIKELGQQFAAGMQTVAVVPVLPHGVVQFGSYKKIMENMGFINDVMSLILQLGNVPGVLLSENYAEKELAPRIGVPVLFGNPIPVDSSLQSNMMGASSLFDGLNYVKSSNPISMFGNLQSNVATFQTSNTGASHPKSNNFHHEVKTDSPAPNSDFFPPNILMNRLPKAEVIPSNCAIWTKQHASRSASLNSGTMRCTEPQIMAGDGIQGHFSNSRMSSGTSLNYHSSDGYVTPPSAEENGLCQNVMSNNIIPVLGTNSVADAKVVAFENLTPVRASSELKSVNFSKMVDSNPDSVDISSANSSVTYSWGSKNQDVEKKLPKSELGKNSNCVQHLYTAPVFPSFAEDETNGKVRPVVSSYREDSCLQAQSGDDLFDVLGADFKNKLISGCWNSSSSNEFAADAYNWDSGIFLPSCSDNLLEAVVSTVRPSAKQNLDDSVSCKTSLTHTSCSSASPMASLPLGRLGASELAKGDSFVVSKYLEKAGAVSANSQRTGFSKEDSESYSQSSSFYASQVSSWTGKGQNTKQNNSGSNRCSRNTEETGKTNRKRLKPGENPKPRPKDRQMIQDRVKELREIVPNGAKCSIDALLERTIKHMLFLQSVSKHGDKLKQIGESKVISKDGGLLPKEDFKGGSTWAYEVGSQSVLCLIIVEDLNQPRQMLVEMFFEERGLFLEIADIIRGLGLTILKGVMETRNDKIWARFIVEANRDVTRMEIFLSLVRLLEQTAKPGTSQHKNTSSENMMVEQLHQSAASPIGG